MKNNRRKSKGLYIILSTLLLLLIVNAMPSKTNVIFALPETNVYVNENKSSTFENNDFENMLLNPDFNLLRAYGYEGAAQPLLTSEKNLSYHSMEEKIERAMGLVDIAHEVKLIAWMINIANDEAHGYCQYANKEVNGGISTGRNLSPDIDCSSFVYYGLLISGFSVNDLGSEPFTTHDMDEILINCGFAKHVFRNESDLEVGDILWREGHTEVYIGNGNTVGAHISETGGKNGIPGDQTGREVCVKELNNNWKYVFRK